MPSGGLGRPGEWWRFPSKGALYKCGSINNNRNNRFQDPHDLGATLRRTIHVSVEIIFITMFYRPQWRNTPCSKFAANLVS